MNFKKFVSCDTDNIEFYKKNSNGESLVMCVTHYKVGRKNYLQQIWYELGYTDKILTNYLVVKNFVKCNDGVIRDKYNPMQRKNFNCNCINDEHWFDWLLEDTEQNEKFQIFPNSVKIFDYGKFCGLVTGVHRLDALQPRKKFEVVHELRKQGIYTDASYQRKFLTDGINIYAVCDEKIMTLDEYKMQNETRGQ